MRRALYVLAVVAALALAWSALTVQRARSDDSSREAATRQALHRLTEAALMHGAVEQGRRASAPRYPSRPDPAWFDEDAGGVPMNPLTGPGATWVDIAPPRDAGLHPPDPVLDGTGAGFWYHPGRGLFRARVERQASKAATLRLYNRVNGTSLDRLPLDESPERRPTAVVTLEVIAATEQPALPVVTRAKSPRPRPTLRNVR